MSFDRNDPADLLALKTEVNDDPTGVGYDPTGPTAAILAFLNDKNPATLVAKPKISSAAIRTGVTFDAYDGLSPDEQEWLRWVTGSNGFEEENLPVTPDLGLQLTGNGTPADSMWAVPDRAAMVAAMEAIFNVPGSRAEILFGFGTVITSLDWTTARDS